MRKIQRASRLRRQPDVKAVPRVPAELESRAGAGSSVGFPEGFWDWTEEKQEAWVEQLIRDVWDGRKQR
jgi:hypothetical protein